MTAAALHLVRHGEVQNPDGVLYARLPGFHLTDRGVASAAAVADHLADRETPLRRLISSPLERAVESAAPIADRFSREIQLDDRVIEASSRLEGGRFAMSLGILAKPAAWRYLVNPFRPSWGEPFADVAGRVVSALREAWDTTDSGDVVVVSHQLPIWMAHRVAAGERLFHDPRARRCSLSSVTSFVFRDGRLVETGYAEPARGLDAGAIDVGAV